MAFDSFESNVCESDLFQAVVVGRGVTEGTMAGVAVAAEAGRTAEVGEEETGDGPCVPYA